MKRFFRKIHLWLSVPFGLLLTLVCFSGAMLVFEPEINELSRPDLYRVAEIGTDRLPADRLAAAVAATLPDSVEVTGVSLSSDPERTALVSLSKPRRAAVAVNPYTGEVMGRVERTPFFAKMFALHRWLLDSPKSGGAISVGKTVVGVTTIAFVLVLLSGIVVWWPRTRRALKESLKIPVRRGSRRFWYGLHVAGGMYALVFLLAMALTGLTWSFSWYRSGFYALMGVEMKADAHGGPGAEKGKDAKNAGRPDGSKGDRPERTEKSEARKGDRPERTEKSEARKGDRPERTEKSEARKGETDFRHWQQVADVLIRRNPDYRLITVSDAKATVAFDRYGNQRAADRYDFDPATGRILSATPYAEAEPAQQLRGWIYSVHVGSWGGLATRVLAFLAALLGASLPLTGYYLWLRRLLRKR